MTSAKALRFLRNLRNVFDPHRTGFFRSVSTPASQLIAEKGEAFVASHRIESFGNGETTYYAVRTADQEPTIVNLNMNVEGKVRVRVYEDGQVSEGEQVLSNNLNRQDFGQAVSDVEVLADVTVDQQGTQIATGGAGGGTKPGEKQTVPANVVGTPWILKTSTTYIYEIENASGDTIDLNPTLGYSTRDI